MADYKASTVSGTSWQRAARVLIDNPLGENPTITYKEERVIKLSDTEFDQKTVGQLQHSLNMADVIALIDLETGTLTGETILVSTIYQAIASDYIARALARDSTAG